VTDNLENIEKKIDPAPLKREITVGNEIGRDIAEIRDGIALPELEQLVAEDEFDVQGYFFRH
jgi:hypothetical protein